MGTLAQGGRGTQSGGGRPEQQLAGFPPASAGSGHQLTEFLQGLRTLMGRFEGGHGQPPQVTPLTAPVTESGGGSNGAGGG